MVTKTLSELDPHPIRTLLPVIQLMETMGHNRLACLRGTGLSPGAVEDRRAKMSVQQELRFYQNILALTGDPCVGLRLGETFPPQSYGLFGYALFSAETFRHALSIAQQFGRLTFSFFSFSFGVAGSDGWFAMHSPPDLEPSLLNFYYDRDMSAAKLDFEAILGCQLPLRCVQFPHDGMGHPTRYEQHFGCAVEFGCEDARLYFDARLLDEPLPQADPESSNHLKQQCQFLIGRLAAKGPLVDEVRMLILARPGYFPDIDFIAERMGISVSTLRRRLKNEGHSYRELVNDARFFLAREYLLETDLSLDEISRLLGYSDAANFSHAFRRWTDMAPSLWRERNA